tara:strand:- start:892 stop:1758 length:867 start_codon:yes stop_codon:yes gene_type:complete
MSTELSVTGHEGKSLAELMGVSAPTSSGPTIARLNLVQSPMMGEIEVNGKKLRTEVIGVGAFKITMGDDTYYANSVKLRVFTQRQQWQRWNSDTNEMEKSVLANSVNSDLADSVGGFNLGRPSGYIEDWNALPDKTKDIIRSVKRVKVVMGALTVDSVMNEMGEPVVVEINNMPVIFDVKNRDSLKALDSSLSALHRKNLLPIMANLSVDGVIGDLPNGNQYAYFKSAVADTVELSDGDNQTLQDFLELISYINTKIMDLHHERSGSSMSKEDTDLVSSIIDVDEAPF